jgi:hypothetical protein
MDSHERERPTPLGPPKTIVGEWYLKGFADAYGAHWAVVPCGPAGEQYRRGYALGLTAVRHEYFVACWNSLLNISHQVDI